MLNVPLKTPFKTAMRTVNAIEDVVLIVDIYLQSYVFGFLFEGNMFMDSKAILEKY